MAGAGLLRAPPPPSAARPAPGAHPAARRDDTPGNGRGARERPPAPPRSLPARRRKAGAEGSAQGRQPPLPPISTETRRFPEEKLRGAGLRGGGCVRGLAPGGPPVLRRRGAGAAPGRLRERAGGWVGLDTWVRRKKWWQGRKACSSSEFAFCGFAVY